MIVIPTCQYNIYYDDYGNSSKYLFDWNHVLPPFKRNGQTIGFIDVIITFNSFSGTCISSWWHDIRNTKKLVLLPVLNLIINYYSPFFEIFLDFWFLLLSGKKRSRIYILVFVCRISQCFLKRLILVVAPCLLPVLGLTDLYFYPQ